MEIMVCLQMRATTFNNKTNLDAHCLGGPGMPCINSINITEFGGNRLNENILTIETYQPYPVKL